MLRQGDLRKTALTAAGNDQDCSFLLVEIAGDELCFQTISRTGRTVGSEVIRRVAAALSGVKSLPVGPGAARSAWNTNRRKSVAVANRRELLQVARGRES